MTAPEARGPARKASTTGDAEASATTHEASPPARVMVFFDYQNVYGGARQAFHTYDAHYTDGQIDPVRLAELLTSMGMGRRQLTEIRIYRGRPDATRDPKGYAANLRQCGVWQGTDPRVHLVTRTLRYPRNWPQEAAQEKGIDVALALDVVTMAIREEYDVAVVMSTDSDIKPALEAVVALGGNPYPRCEVAAWSSPRGYSRRLSISGRRLWCHWLGENEYRAVADPTDYAADDDA